MIEVWKKTALGALILGLVVSGCVSEGPGSDFDRDGLTDDAEDLNENFAFDVGETSFLDTDTDRDGLCDGLPRRAVIDPCQGCEDCDNSGTWEPCLGETDPLNDDTDNDGVRDANDPTPAGNVDCSGGQNPSRTYGDSVPPGKPLPDPNDPTPTPVPTPTPAPTAS